MVKLSKYLNPFMGLVLLCIGLLFVQAMADLSLPDFMSTIVNTGIQQGGIEDAVPEAIRAEQMEKLLLFVDVDDRQRVREAYTPVDSESPSFADYVERYPIVADEPILVLNEIDEVEIEELNPIMARALVIVSGIERAIENPDEAPEGMDFSQVPPGMDVFDALALIPDAQRAELTATADEQFAAMGEGFLVAGGARTLKDEYAALGMDTDSIQNNFIINNGVLMIGIALISGAATVAVAFFSSKIAAGLARNLRLDVFKKVETFSNKEFDKFSTASLITRSTNDITQIQMITMMMIRMVIYAPILAVGGIFRAIAKSPEMSWIIAVAVIVLVGFIIGIFSVSLSRFKIIQDLIDRLNLVTRENLTGMMVIRAFNTQKFEEKRFDDANTDLTTVSLFVNRVMSAMLPVMMLVMNGVTVAIIWVGAHQVADSRMQVGDMIAFLQYAMQIIMAFLFLSMMFIMLPRASVSADRIAEVLETESSINDPVNPKRLPEPFKGVVEFRNVCFRYPDAEENVLHDISFTARPGETTAIIGSTGSGKSTVINLIPRFYDVTEGAILLDGVDIREVTQHDLRAKIGYIPQKGMLFSGTIESNLRYADEFASADRLTEAARVAQATEFIADKADGLATDISQGGTNVSGGQRQRLAIARALVTQPPIYIFDDSFSALDYRTDVALRKALKESTGNSTVLIVAQRISTIKTAEQIVVLDEGRIVGIGTHDELMADCETYREIALSQLSREELAV